MLRRRAGTAAMVSVLALGPGVFATGVTAAAAVPSVRSTALPPLPASPYRIASFGGCGAQPRSYVVPPDAHAVSVIARGGAGGWSGTTHGGDPGLTVSALETVPGETLRVYAGCVGGDASNASTAGGVGGAGSGQGGTGGATSIAGYGGGGGGGGSALVRGTTRLLVAGGGGGGGGGPQSALPTNGQGGAADHAGAQGFVGGHVTFPGSGASRTDPGAGSAIGGCCDGAAGVGHDGGAGGSGSTNPIGGGGGGGGWFGGGGGGGGTAGTTTGAGGGGGSSAVRDRESGYTTNVPVGHTTASRNGRVKILTMKPATRGPSWPGWDIARGVAVNPLGSGGYLLDGFGGIHPFASGTNPLPPAVSGTAYWSGWDIARSIALLPDGTGGVVLDGFGGLHPFGIGGHAAPTVTGSAYWPGFDIARGIAIQPDGTSGYVIDGLGGRHAISVNGSTAPGLWGYPSASPDWPNDVARGISIAFEVHAESGTAVLGGYVSDAFGGIHPVGQQAPLGTHGAPTFSMPPALGAPYWPTWAIARGVSAYPNGYGGYELDGFGGLHSFVFTGQA